MPSELREALENQAHGTPVKATEQQIADYEERRKEEIKQIDKELKMAWEDEETRKEMLAIMNGEAES